MGEYQFDFELNIFTKNCPKCGVIYEGGATQDIAERNLSKYFCQDKHTKDGFYGSCRTCVSKYMRGKRGGRLCDPDKLLAEQANKCGICGKELKYEQGKYAKITAYVDHDHDTNAVRGILCARCNSQLPIVDDPIWLKQAVDYLRKYGKEVL